MDIDKISFSSTYSFSKLFLDYIEKDKNLKSFYNHFPTLDGFREQIKEKIQIRTDRTQLIEVITAQYQHVSMSAKVFENIQFLQNENTFTITTGHQINIFSGPLYFIYKIISVINICKQLKAIYPAYHFVPIYWMATEDHDFAEINHFHWFGQKYVWESEQTGAVGRFNLDGFSSFLDQLPEKVDVFEKAYRSSKNLADATRFFVNELFGEYGLIALDADDVSLKKIFSEYIKADIFDQKHFDLLRNSSHELEELGYKVQAHPREINFFYMQKHSRERIEQHGNEFRVLNTSITFSEKALEMEIDQHPERFSPNVLLRPLYQEVLLPNLAYIGGPAEIAYWLQLYAIFEYHAIPFPILVPRSCALIVPPNIKKKMDKLSLSSEDIFLDFLDLKHQFLNNHTQNNLNIDAEKEEIALLFERLTQKAQYVDQSLVNWIGAEGRKVMKNVEHIEVKLKKSEERKHEIALSQLNAIKEKLFPSGLSQERVDNLLSFYLNHPDFLEVLLQHLDPFDFSYSVVYLD